MCSSWQQGTGFIIPGWESHPCVLFCATPATRNGGTEPGAAPGVTRGGRCSPVLSPRAGPARCQHLGSRCQVPAPSSPGISTPEHCYFQLPFPGSPALPYPDTSHTNNRLPLCRALLALERTHGLFHHCFLLPTLTPTAPGNLVFSSPCPSFPSGHSPPFVPGQGSLQNEGCGQSDGHGRDGSISSSSHTASMKRGSQPQTKLLDSSR